MSRPPASCQKFAIAHTPQKGRIRMNGFTGAGFAIISARVLLFKIINFKKDTEKDGQIGGPKYFLHKN